MMRYISICLLVGVTACGQSGDPVKQDQSASSVTEPSVYTVNYPLAWAAAELAGNAAEVVFPAPADIDPAFWEPELDAVAGYQAADVILLNGAGYAKWVDRVSVPQNRTVDTSTAFSDEFIVVESGPVHSHGPEGEHSHGERAFTTWLDLAQFAQQVDATADALSGVLPERSESIEAQHLALSAALKRWDMELQAIGEQLDGAPLLYSHPVYQYLQRRYGLNGVALHWEPDQTPGERDWAELDGILARHPARLMLWEDEPTAETREGLTQRGIAVVVFRPLGNRPEAGDFASVMQENIEQLMAAATKQRKTL